MRPSLNKDYQPVNQRESVEDSETVEKLDGISSLDSQLQKCSSLYLSKVSPWISWTRWIPWALIPCLMISNWHTWTQLAATKPSNAVFSPASSAIKFKNVVFQAGIDSDMSPYQGPPTPESDQLWEELHKYGVSKIPMSEAAQLTNRTSPIPGDEGNYVVILEVFHQLHCLSHVRRRLFWNETSSPDEVEALNMKHIDHCIDSIRQSLMCSGDIIPLPYVWWSKYDQLLPSPAVPHTCRDFDALRDWAKEHRVLKLDNKLQVTDPLGEQVVYDLGH